MIACARAATLTGLLTDFVDCDNRLLMDIETIDPTDLHEAIMPVHIYGRRCNMSGVTDYASRHGLAVIEDMAEIHGIQPHRDTDAACWSFYRNKIIHGEEGGMVAFRNPDHAARARELRSCGFTDKHDFLHVPRGMNYRMSNLHAAAILPSLEAVESNLEKRRTVEGWYDAETPSGWQMPPRDVCWVYDVRIPGMSEKTQDRVIRELNGQGISARHAFKPMSRQPEYLGDYKGLNAHRLSAEVIYFPIRPDNTRDHVRRCMGALRSAV
jgi:dTDP-4-amino-4,6-dideoxygalactose transaminase